MIDGIETNFEEDTDFLWKVETANGAYLFDDNGIDTLRDAYDYHYAMIRDASTHAAWEDLHDVILDVLTLHDGDDKWKLLEAAESSVEIVRVTIAEGTGDVIAMRVENEEKETQT